VAKTKRNNFYERPDKMTRYGILTFAVLITCGWLLSDGVFAGDTFAPSSIRQPIIEQTKFIQIPGPNPVITPGKEGAWDDSVVEASDAFRDVGTYYFYYHACGAGKGYRLGVASSDHPLGPFKKHGDKPILDLGKKGEWDSKHVACAMVMKGGGEKYYMWYSGCSDIIDWSIGLATASSPLGPWEKYEGNPVIKDFGYLGGVVKVDGKYRIYSAHPIHQPWAGWEEGKNRSKTYHSDYSPLAVAIGDEPHGPFEISDRNPLMVQGNEGDWDEGGISEAEVLYHNGMFHMFYGATERLGPRTEHIGYAYSFDGFEFFKFGANPVASRHVAANTAAFAEVHSIIDPPFIYLYHTLRPEYSSGRRFGWDENLGVQILVTQAQYCFDMPVLNVDLLASGKSTKIDDSAPIPVGCVGASAITVECTFGDKTDNHLSIGIRSSHDGINYDTVDLNRFHLSPTPVKKVRGTFGLNTNVRFVKVVVEHSNYNKSTSMIGKPKESDPISNIKVFATLRD
jgi:predicted GH43/DUF377 family glycosyl hydrolase